jgi:pimeloyl-ACP methyl ester carboxylesterase
MSRAGRLALTAGAIAGGAALGYLAERAVLRDRLQPEPTDEPPLGSIAGEVTEIRGPDGLRLTVETYGPVDAPQIVFTHGWVCTGRVWHEQVRALSDRFRLVTYDQPGHGRSSRPRSGAYDLDLFGDALVAVIEQATAPGPVVVCGHSLGGMTIMNALRRHPQATARVQAALLLSTTSRAAADDVTFGFGIHSVARLERAISRVASLGRRDPRARYLADRFYRASTDLSFLLTRFFGLARDADPRYVDFTEQLLLDSDFDMITGVMAPILTIDEDEALPGFAVPTWVVCGTADKLTPLSLSRRMADRCASADLVELPGIGHMTPLEGHEAINRLLGEVVSRVAEAA